MTPDTNTFETPLLDLLRSVPLDGRDLYSHGGPFETHSIPYGRHCHAAAAEIARLQEQVDALAGALLEQKRADAYTAAYRHLPEAAEQIAEAQEGAIRMREAALAAAGR